jgi:hypothetical protein
MEFVWRRFVLSFTIASIFCFKLMPGSTGFVAFVPILQIGK